MIIKRVGVVGGGTMGQGIVQATAQAGIPVILQEISKEALERSLAGISAQLDEEISKWGITAKEKQAILSRVSKTVTYENFNQLDLIIEAVDEIEDSKIKIFEALRDICQEETIFATNTSTLSVSNLAVHSGRPDRFIGMHFKPPVPKRPLIELVRGFNTSNETFTDVKRFAEELDKQTVEVFEWPGYVTTRLILPLINEAVYALMEGVASADDIDKAMVLGFAMQMGPLHMADAMGLDSVVFHMEHLFHELGDLKYRPCPYLKKMIRAGCLGVKSGKGFFTYDRPEAAIVHYSFAK